ncbi:MAG: YraN family protein [Symbiopectobacterium sp.]|uniref:YraN family protein n=1 Tax=Symbiopectobacterium sp. TaxID=2952789 RepID=UPI003F396413
MNRRATGTYYQQHARRYLEHHAGLTFVASNVNCHGGELDLIMQDGHTWVFVKVRYRKNAQFGSAAESVTPRKQQRLLNAAALWLAQRQQSFDTTSCRFGILAITGEHYDCA